MKIATVKNFIRGGNFTTLYYVVKTILQHDNYCQRKFIDAQFDDWHYFRSIQLKFGDGLVNTKEDNKSFYSITPELYEVYADAMMSINRQPISWTDIPKTNDEVENTKDIIDNEVNITKDKIDSEINKTRDAINREIELTRQKEKDNIVHYVDYDMEESMNFRTAANLLNENGYQLIKESQSEVDILDFLCKIVSKYTQQNGIKWQYDSRIDRYKRDNKIYEMYTEFDYFGRVKVKINIKDGVVTGIDTKYGFYSPEEFAEEFVTK